MKRLRLFIGAAIAGLSCASSTNAGIITSIDLDGSMAGVQTTNVYVPGDIITANVLMELSETTSLSSYNFSVRYDPSELMFVSRSETPLQGLSELDSTNGVDMVNGIITRIDGATLGNGPTAPFGPVSVATLTFSVLAPIGGIADIDIETGRFDPEFDFAFDNAGNEVTGDFTFAGASIQGAVAVPEPTSLIILSAAGLGAYGWRRKRKA